MNRRIASVTVLFVLASLAVTARASAEESSPRPLASDARVEADPAETEAHRFHIDAEVDPTAYVLSGFSGHLGLGLDRFRLDLGAYAMEIPQAIHGDDRFDVRFDGFGAKLHAFPFAKPGAPQGLFFGVDSGVTRARVTNRAADESATQSTVSAGAHVGYRIALPLGFYATPWLGVGYAFGAHDVTLAGATFKANPVTIFPAIHLGYRFI